MDAMIRWRYPAAVALMVPALLLPASIAAAAPDGTVQQATYQTAAEVGRPATVPQKTSEPMPIGAAGRDSSEPGAGHGRREAPTTLSSGPAFLSMFGSLAIVIGLFLGLVWLLRRGSPKAARLLSSEVVELLGRSPLAGRQQMNVIRFGNRLLLVAVSPDGAETLSEINDPAEVDRLAGLCQQSETHSATNAFRQIFGQLADMRRPAQLDTAAKNNIGAPHGARDSASSRHAEDDDV